MKSNCPIGLVNTQNKESKVGPNSGQRCETVACSLSRPSSFPTTLTSPRPYPLYIFLSAFCPPNDFSRARNLKLQNAANHILSFIYWPKSARVPEIPSCLLSWYPSVVPMEVNARDAISTLPIIGASQHPKPQLSAFTRPVQMGLFARVTSYPPLGQTTCIQRAQKALRSEEDDTVRIPSLFKYRLVRMNKSQDAHYRYRSILPSSWNQAQRFQRSLGKSRYGITSSALNGQLSH